MCGEVYGMVESTTFVIVKDLCVIIRKHLKPLVIKILTSNSIRRLTYEFENFKAYLFFGVVDGNHILITTTPIDSTFYY